MRKKVKNIEVAVRMRPLLDKYQDSQAWIANSEQNTISSIPKKSFSNQGDPLNEDCSIINQNLKRRQSKVVEKNNVYQFTYDYVFSQEQKNSQVYSQSCKRIVQQFLKGKNASIFMYGQTTSGKTYTMLGSQNQQGLIIYSLKDIFKNLQKTQQSKVQSVYISYMQIYNEQINDLLNPQGLNLKVVDDHAQGLSQFEIFSFKEAIQLLEEGQKLRSYAQKNFHDHSSRSHTIFQIKLIENNKQTGKVISKNLLNLVDLAGSERVGQQESNEETGYINKSLFVLSNVIHKLSQKKSGHVPFRDSKLTRVLSSSLTSSSHTIFICTISPAQLNFTQSLSTLRFANQSRKVQLKSVEDSSLILNESSFIIQQKQINKLKQQNVCLRKNLSQKQNQNSSSPTILESTIQKLEDLIKQEQNKEGKENKQNRLLISNTNYRRHYSKGKQQSKYRNKNKNTIQKLHVLYSQYKRNVEILQKEYIKAMINLTSTDLGINKQQIKKKITIEDDPSHDQIYLQ